MNDMTKQCATCNLELSPTARSKECPPCYLYRQRTGQQRSKALINHANLNRRIKALEIPRLKPNLKEMYGQSIPPLP